MAAEDQVADPVRNEDGDVAGGPEGPGDAEGSGDAERPERRHPQPQPPVVRATVTYTPADIRAIALTSITRTYAVVLVVWLIAMAFLTIFWVIDGRTMSLTQTVTVLAAAFVGYAVVRLPARAAKQAAADQSWTISAEGVRVCHPGAEALHDWSRIDEVVLRPALVQFRIGEVGLGVPRRYLTDHDVDTIEALATGGNVTFRRGGTFRGPGRGNRPGDQPAR